MGFTCGLMSEVNTGQLCDVRGPVTNGNRQVNKPEGSGRLTSGLKRKVKGRYRSRQELGERRPGSIGRRGGGVVSDTLRRKIRERGQRMTE